MIAIKDRPHHTDGEGDDRFYLKPRISCFWSTRRKYSQNTCVGTVAEVDPLGVDRLAQLLDESVQKPHVSLVGAQLRIESAWHVDTGQVDDRHGLGGDADGTLDPASGTGGVLITRIQGDDLVSLLAIQPDGKILAVGTSQNAADVMELALARYLSQ